MQKNGDRRYVQCPLSSNARAVCEDAGALIQPVVMYSVTDLFISEDAKSRHFTVSFGVDGPGPTIASVVEGSRQMKIAA